MSIAQYQFSHDGRVNHARVPGKGAYAPWPEEIGLRGDDVTLQLQAVEAGQAHNLPSSLTADIALLGHLFPKLIEFFAGIELTKEVSEIVDWAVTLA